MKFLIALIAGLLVGTGAYADVTGNITPPGGVGATIPIPLTNLVPSPPSTVLGNATGSAAAPGAVSVLPFAFTAFTASGCTNSTLVGGYTALTAALLLGGGSFTIGASGTCTITLTFGTAPHFWNCNGASNITSQILFVQTARSATTCTISGAGTTNDIVTFTAVGT